MSCLSLYLGTVLKVWYVIIIFSVPKLYKQDIPHLQNSLIIMRNKTYYISGTVPKYNEMSSLYLPSEQFLNIMINKTYHTFITVPQYNDKQDIPHLQNSS